MNALAKVLNDEQVRDFEINRELNLGFTLNDVGRTT